MVRGSGVWDSLGFRADGRTTWSFEVTTEGPLHTFESACRTALFLYEEDPPCPSANT